MYMNYDTDFKVTTLFEVEYRKNLKTKLLSYYCTRGNCT